MIEVGGLELHSLMILRHGKVIAEGWWNPYRRARPHMLFSMTKSFTAMAVGLAVTEGLITVDDDVSSFFPEIPVTQPGNFRPIRIRDLLTMSVGHRSPTMGSKLRQLQGSWVEYFLTMPIDHEPGTRFKYNTIASHHMLSVIVERVVKLPMRMYLEKMLFRHLDVTVCGWDVSPEGHTTGASGLSLCTEDIAKFGQFILQKGHWQGRQIVSDSWIEACTSFQIPTGDDVNSDSQQGYGYQFWKGRHGSVRADGAFGQLCVICPEQDAVIVTTGGLTNTSPVLNLMWEYLLPAMGHQAQLEASDFRAKLNHRLATLKLSVPTFKLQSTTADMVTGRRYIMESNDYGIQEITFEFSADLCTIYVRDGVGTHRIDSGYESPVEGITDFTSYLMDVHFHPKLRVAAHAGWKDTHQLAITMCFVEAPFVATLNCDFESERKSTNTDDNNGGEVRVTLQVNIDSASGQRPTLVGSAV